MWQSSRPLEIPERKAKCDLSRAQEIPSSFFLSFQIILELFLVTTGISYLGTIYGRALSYEMGISEAILNGAQSFLRKIKSNQTLDLLKIQ